MKKPATRISALAFAIALATSGCAADKTPRQVADRQQLVFGTAIQPATLTTPAEAQLVRDNFNLIVPENTMKWENLRPNADFWNWPDLDAMVAFAEKNKMLMRGHTFVWHQQNPAYVENLKTREEAIALLDDHITTVMTRYKGRIAEYDVANEVLNDNGTMRETLWYRTIGPDYIDIAFAIARKADPDARLVLNDYNNETKGSAKAEAFFKLAKSMKDRGIPIDGVGFQLHLMAKYPPAEKAIRDNIRRFADIGLFVAFTEVDVRVEMPVTADREAAQTAIFETVLDIARTEPNARNLIFWCYTDKNSWIPRFFPGYGSAHLFDADLNPKQAFLALAEEIRSKPVKK